MRPVWVVCVLCWAGAAAAQEAVHEAPAKKASTTKASSKKAPASTTKSSTSSETTTKVKATKVKATASKSAAGTRSKTASSTHAAASPPPSAAAPVEAAPVAPAPPPPPSAANGSRVAVPTTPHFHVDVPAGLQAWLDADDRMRPWLGKAVAAVDSCYADVRRDSASAAGVITFSVTMHQNARPTAAVSSLPAPLRSLVPCVTTSLWSVRMPLFTGDEGARYDVAAHFEP